MILACPSCATRFLVADEALHRPGGRRVRCGNCGHLWRHMPDAAPPPLRLEPEPSLAASAGPPLRLDAEAGPAASSEAPPMPPPTRQRHGWAAAGWLVLILVLGAAVALATFARREIVALWPPAARLYALVGAPAQPLGAGLEISRIVPTRTPDGLVIAGEIENKSDIPRDVPRLRVVLRDDAQKPVQSKTVAPPKPRLLPGEVAHFKTPFAHPNDAATGVVVTFAPS
jgi:predicted Zn finger-like uncharacterized protein